MAAPGLSFLSSTQQVEKLLNGMAALGRMPHRTIGVQFVKIVASVPESRDVPVALQIGDDALYRTLGYADDRRDFPGGNVPVSSDAEKNLRVIGKKSPL